MAYFIWGFILVGIEAGVIYFLGIENLLGINIVSLFILAFLFCRTMIFSGAIPTTPSLKNPGKTVISYSDMKEITELDRQTMKASHEKLRSKAFDHIVLLMIVLNVVMIIKSS